MIELNLVARTGDFRLSAALQGEGVICIAGKNGSGKTTLMRAIAGLLPVESGYIRLDGADVARLPPEKRGVVLVSPSTFIRHLDVDSHIVWGAKQRRSIPSTEAVSRVKRALGIDYSGTVGNLSRGMRQRVALATALLASPRAILVDEAFSGLHQREAFISAYGRLVKESGIDLLFSSQDEGDGSLSDALYVISGGSTTQSRKAQATGDVRPPTRQD